MEKGKEKFTDGEKQILLSIVRSVKANIDKIECRPSQKLILNWFYNGIIEKIQSNIRFNEVEIECLVELLTERVDHLLQLLWEIASIRNPINSYLKNGMRRIQKTDVDFIRQLQTRYFELKETI